MFRNADVIKPECLENKEGCHPNLDGPKRHKSGTISDKRQIDETPLMLKCSFCTN
jgi:hypothetical protein